LFKRSGARDPVIFVFNAEISLTQLAAVEFRAYCFVAIGKAIFWLAFRTQWWLPFTPPRISTLGELHELNFPATYNKFIIAVWVRSMVLNFRKLFSEPWSSPTL
jgi:hypothetical protein